MRHQQARMFRAFLNAALIAMVAATSKSHATDGALDATFGTGGIALAGLATITGGSHPIVQPDGKIIYCSVVSSGGTSGDDFVVLRFNADGTPDSTFSFDGKVTIDFDGGYDGCNGLALQPDGKIIAIGYTVSQGADYDFAIARLNADGSLDSTFGSGTGRTTVAFDLADTHDDRARAVALQPDGKIVVAGYALAGVNQDYDFAVVRLSADGTRDTTFNGSGRVTIPFDMPQSTHRLDEAESVAIDGVGRIVVAGSAEAGDFSFDFGVARLLPDGQIDDEFDADGRLTIAFDIGATKDDDATHMIVQNDGRIVLAGYVDTSLGTEPNYDFAVARIRPDGSSDADFGVDGKVVVPFDIGGPQNDFAYGVVEDEAARLIVAGSSTSSDTTYNATLVRLMRDGTIDPGFGTYGKVTISQAGRSMTASGAAFQGTQIVIAGGSFTNLDSDDYVARLEVDLLFADGFE